MSFFGGYAKKKDYYVAVNFKSLNVDDTLEPFFYSISWVRGSLTEETKHLYYFEKGTT
jgi:hypothetical protein